MPVVQLGRGGACLVMRGGAARCLVKKLLHFKIMPYSML